MEEIWKDVPGYEGYYQVSNTGKYRSLDRSVERSDGKVMHIKGKELKCHPGLDNYALMSFTKDGKCYSMLAHRIVCQLFFPDFDPSLTVNHKDGNKFNNSIDNLEMVTIQENIHHFRTSPVFAEVRKRMYSDSSKRQKGIPKSPESVEKQRVSLKKYHEMHKGPRKGAIPTRDTCKKISFGQGTHVRCVETNQYFTSYKKAAQYFKVDITTMIEWCKQGMNRHGKSYSDLHFEITDEADYSKYIF